MSRLTIKDKSIRDNFNAEYAKLADLEDIEELCEKMITQPIYEIYYGASEIHEVDYIGSDALYNFKEKRIEIVNCFEIENWFKLDDYGKTWALTKEELL